MAKKFSFIFFFLIVLVVCLESVLAARRSLKRIPKPCKRLVLHIHDNFQQGNSFPPNATSAIVTKSVPEITTYPFGELHVYDDPVTLDQNINSPPTARARGFYLYNSRDTINTLFLITLNFNSSEYTGTLTMLGNNEHLQKTRDLSIVGGTGDFFMARGITTLESDVLDFKKSYFRLRMDIKLYECY